MAVAAEPKLLPLGQVEVIVQGTDLAIVAVGRAVGLAKEALVLLGERELSVELINARYIKPLDPQFVANLSKRFSRIVTLEDNVVTGGFGSSLLEALGQQSYTGEVLCIGVPDEFVEQGRVDILLELLNMETESVVERILCRWPEFGSRLTLELRKIGQS